MTEFFDVDPPTVNKTLLEDEDLYNRLYTAFTNSDDLRQKAYRGNPNIVSGHCYVASEVMYHLLGAEWQSYHIKHEGLPHWFLKNKNTNEILDVTKDQFKTPVPYENGRRTPFMTKKLSKRGVEFKKRMGL